MLLIFTLWGCKNTFTEETIAQTHIYPTTSYLDIKLDSNGHLPSNPYILSFENGKKQVVFCGVNHLTDNSDIHNPMFARIEQHFFGFRPDICINEGGDVSKKQYRSKDEALLQDAEIGLTKVLCDSLGISSVNGDMTDSLEFKALLAKYTKGEFLVYIVTERLMWGLKGEGISDSTVIRERYHQFIRNYIMQKGRVPLTETEQDFGFYQSNYEKLLGRPFALRGLEPTNPFDPNGKFQEIGRSSKEIRDQYLLRTVDSLLNKHDKVFIVFGGWHLLTCEPGLKEIINRKR